MGTVDKATSFGLRNGRATLRPHQQKILQACKQNADQYIENLIKQVIDKFDETLINRSNKEGDDQDSDSYVEAERELCAKRQEILIAFNEGFTRYYTARLNSAGTAAASSKKEGGQAGGLSLVDEHELEESLAVDGLVARARDRLRNELYALAQRFNVLIDGASYDDESQPYDPEVIAYAFRDAIQKLEFKVEVKLIAYKLFEQGVMQTVGQFYLQVNSILSDAGVLPELKLSVPARAVGGTSQSRTTDKLAADAPGDPGGNVQGQVVGGVGGESQGGLTASGDVYQTLQKLMNARKYGDTPGEAEGAVSGDGNGWEVDAGGGATPGSSLLADDLLRALSLLQHEAPPVTPEGVINIGAIKDALLGQMKQIGDGRGIDPAHDNTIDVIGMIFEFILDEPSIPDVVKNLLNCLQIPILKVAIVDKAFFTNKTHSARRLLNVLGHASIGWNENSEEARQRRFEKMEYVVSRVLSEFEQDPGIFGALLDEFSEFLTKEGEDVGEEQEGPIEGQDQGDSSDKLVFETIELRLEGAEVPEVLRDFLRSTWRNVLQHVLDEDGFDSDGWRRCEQTVDDLMWSVEPKTTSDERRKMVMSLPRLLGDLREGMKRIQCAPEEIDGAIDALEPIHMACLRGEKPIIEEPESPSPARVAATDEVSSDDVTDMIRSIQAGMTQTGDGLDEVALNFEDGMMESSVDAQDQDDGGVEDVEDEYTVTATEMQLGTWLDFVMDDKNRRGKLAWKSAVMGEYVFVDRKYKVVAERTLAELAADLRSGRATLVENVAMFDRALDKVLNGLMTSGSAAH